MSTSSDPQDGAVDAAAGGYPAHQAFKTKARDVYCSSYIVRNHDEGADWISKCLTHFELRGSDILGKPYLEDDCPKGAIVWP